MISGQLVFYANDFTNPGSRNILTNLPSSCPQIHHAGAATLTVGPANALVAQDANALTVTHRDPAGNLFRTTTIAKITFSGTPTLVMDTTFDSTITRQAQTQLPDGTLVLKKGRVFPADGVTPETLEVLSREELTNNSVCLPTYRERPKSFPPWTMTS